MAADERRQTPISILFSSAFIGVHQRPFVFFSRSEGGVILLGNVGAQDGQCSRVLDRPGTPWQATTESILLITSRGSAISGTTSQRAAIGSRMVRAASSTSYSTRCSRTRRMMGVACSAVPGRSINTDGPLHRKGGASEGRDCTR